MSGHIHLLFLFPPTLTVSQDAVGDKTKVDPVEVVTRLLERLKHDAPCVKEDDGKKFGAKIVAIDGCVRCFRWGDFV